MFTNNTRWLIPLLIVLAILGLLMPRSAQAIPNFSRRYNLNCYACHTIPPVLNEQGYLFKRLGYHLPPPLERGKPSPRISELVQKESKWDVTNNASFAVADASFSAERTTQEGQSPSSTSSFQVNAWNAYFAGWIPNTNFFYFGEFDIVSGGQISTDLPNAYFGYVGGTANSSWYVAVGREHLQVGEGTRAAAVYSLLPSSPVVFEYMGPTNFIVDQAPVGIDLGYTWASSKYRNVLSATVKVTNGDNADGSEILGGSTKNSKDVWVDADWWYAPESGVTFLNYYGRKYQTQNLGQPNEFTYYATVRRQGVFANYMFHQDKLDFLGGYMHARDDWESPDTGAPGSYISNDFFGEVDCYVQRGFALVGRYDRLNQEITGGGKATSFEGWTVGTEKAFTSAGNIVGRLSYSNLHGRDPVSITRSTDRIFQADIAFNF